MARQSETQLLTHLARRLEDDIRCRGLRNGDPYITGAEAGELLDVSPVTASRAMNILAKRGLLVRRRRQGTFVGAGVTPSPSKVRAGVVHYLSFFDELPVDMTLPLGKMLAGLREVRPDATLNVHTLPMQNAVERLQQVLEDIESESTLGLILSLGTREVQEYLSKTSLPIVVHGATYAGVELPCVVHDQKEIGRLMAERAIELGYSRLIFINRELWRRGDELAFDGVMEAVNKAGLGTGSVKIRNAPANTDSLGRDLAGMFDDWAGPTAFLCKTGCFYNRSIVLEARKRGLRIPEDFEIIWDDTFADQVSMDGHERIVSDLNIQGQFRLLGEILQEFANTDQRSCRRVLLSVREGVPDESDLMATPLK